MNKDSSNTELKVGGKMSEQGADKVAVIMAWGKSIAIVIASFTGLIISVTAFISAIKWW